MDNIIYEAPEPRRIYARMDETGVVLRFFSSVFEEPGEDDILIEEGHEEYHAHVHLKYQATDDAGRPIYRLRDGRLEVI
jgi:hypothetical protein